MKGLEDLNLEGLEEAWKNVGEAWEEKNYGAVVANLLVMADKIGQISPVLAPVAFQLIEKYGATLKPMIDQMFASGTKVSAYFYENIAEVKQNLLPQIEKYAVAKAQVHAVNLKALKDVGFSHRDAMDILLAEISGARRSHKSWLDWFKNSNVKFNTRGNRGSRY